MPEHLGGAHGRTIALVGGCLLLGCLITPSSASAVATRAEYIAQVDPICQAFVAPVNAAERSWDKNYKRWVHATNSGTLKAWEKQTRRTSRSLIGFARVLTRLTDQIVTVSPPAADAGTIGTWINERRRRDAFATSAGVAFSQFKFKAYDRRIRQAVAADKAGLRAIAGFGFQVCGVTV